VATDTGITSARASPPEKKSRPGAVACARAMKISSPRKTLAARVEREGVRFVSAIIPPVKASERRRRRPTSCPRARRAPPVIAAATAHRAPLIERLRPPK